MSLKCKSGEYNQHVKLYYHHILMTTITESFAKDVVAKNINVKSTRNRNKI